MNEILMMLIQVLRAGGNPMQAVASMAKGNPIMQQGANMIAGKSPEQVEQIARNMAAQRGVDIDAMLQQLGLK